MCTHTYGICIYNKKKNIYIYILHFISYHMYVCTYYVYICIYYLWINCMCVCNTPLLHLTWSHTVALFCAKRVREAADGFALHHVATSVQVTTICSRPSDEKASLWNFYIRHRYCQHFPYASFWVYKAYQKICYYTFLEISTFFNWSFTGCQIFWRSFNVVILNTLHYSLLNLLKIF